MSEEIKVGDTVVRLTWSKYLTVGAKYVVTGVKYGSTLQVIGDSGMHDWFSTALFKKIPKATKIRLKL